MRTLRITWSRAAGALPILVAAAVGPSACGSVVTTSTTGSGGSTSTTDTSGGGGAGAAAGMGGIGGFGGSGGTGEVCPDWYQPSSLIVDLPQPGTPAEPGQICAQNPPTVVSNTAARVTLTKYSQALNLAMGFVAIAPPLDGTVIGAPTVEVVDAAGPLQGMMVSNVQPATGGFTFHAEWPQMLDLQPENYMSMQVKTTFTTQCGPGPDDTRVVESFTTVHLCYEEKQPGMKELIWVSSGDECKVCDIIAEMAPSPIVPDKRMDDLPLARALRLRVRPIAKVGRSMVLMAENDGGPDVDYAWRATAGDLQQIAPDVVVWTPPAAPGPHMLQAAVTGEHTAGVASYTLEAA